MCSRRRRRLGEGAWRIEGRNWDGFLALLDQAFGVGGKIENVSVTGAGVGVVIEPGTERIVVASADATLIRYLPTAAPIRQELFRTALSEEA